MNLRLISIEIDGFKPFRGFRAALSPLEVIAGANASGKSSLFDFLRFLRDGVHREIPPEIVSGTIGQDIFHRPGDDRFEWGIRMEQEAGESLSYTGEILGPIGSVRVTREEVGALLPGEGGSRTLLGIGGDRGVIYERNQDPAAPLQKAILNTFMKKRQNELALGAYVPPGCHTLCAVRDFLREARFYSGFGVDAKALREPSIVEESPVLYESCANLGSVVHTLFTSHPTLFRDLQVHLRGALPGRPRLSVRPRGGPGRIMVFWEEEGLDRPLSLADLSDGTLRLLCWVTLCVSPNVPSLVCVDEPELGLHPRALPLLAALFEKLSRRTQVLIATHSSYFLAQFDLARIAVMRKEEGQTVFVKPEDSEVLRKSLEDFGREEIEVLHRSDELERLA